MPRRRSVEKITRHIRWLEHRIATVDRDLDDTIQESPAWRAKENLLRTVPGIGPVVRRTLLAVLPDPQCDDADEYDVAGDRSTVRRVHARVVRAGRGVGAGPRS
jgi:transposase